MSSLEEAMMLLHKESLTAEENKRLGELSSLLELTVGDVKTYDDQKNNFIPFYINN